MDNMVRKKALGGLNVGAAVIVLPDHALRYPLYTFSPITAPLSWCS
jgi:hypothetical protein